MLTEQQIDALEAAAALWKDTPFCEGTPMRGIGASCQHVAAGALVDAALLPPIEIPSGPTNWRAQSRSLIEEFMDACPYFVRLAASSLRQPGDTLGFRVGGPIHHVMVQLRGTRVLHSLSRHKAMVAPCIPADWEHRLEAIWRLKIAL